MKKIIYALCVFMLFGLMACNKDVEKRDSIASSQTKKSDEETPLKPDLNEEESEEPEVPARPKSPAKFNLDDESNYWAEINGKKFVFGDNIKDIMDLGFTTDEGDTMVSDYARDIAVYWDGQYCGLLSARNDSGGEKPALECQFSGLIMSYDSSHEGLELSTIGGITHGTSMDDVVDLFGIGDDVYESQYSSQFGYWGEDGKGYSFTFIDDKVDTIHIYQY